VGELPPLVQAKLLRVIEDHEVRPVGGKQAERIDVRIISATNRDLAADEAAGRFRGDLLARLSTVEIFLPPLREHVEDLPALLTHLCARAGLPGLTATPDALEAMALYAWPHNVRELDNLCKSVGLGGNAELTLERLPERISAGFHAARRESDVATLTTGPRATAPPQPPLHLGRAGSGSPDRGRARARAAATEPPPEAEPPPLLPGPRPDREAIVTALIAHGGNVRRASLDLGLARGHLYRLLRRFGVTPDDYRRGDTPLEAHAGPVLAFTRPSQDEP
jgi:DNA-binding NtrC family response regulator